MSIGDLNSNERGSGARFNSGKPDLSLIPPLLLPCENDEHEELLRAMDAIMFQGNIAPTAQALKDYYEIYDASGAVANVFEYGKQKYAAWNWAKGMNWSIPVACTLRHADQLWYRGEVLDPESGLPHIGHIGCNLIMLLHYFDNYPEGNDLPYKVLSNVQTNV